MDDLMDDRVKRAFESWDTKNENPCRYLGGLVAQPDSPLSSFRGSVETTPCQPVTVASRSSPASPACPIPSRTHKQHGPG